MGALSGVMASSSAVLADLGAASSSAVLAAAGTDSFPVLPALVVIPLLGALALLALPRAWSDLLRPVALLFTGGDCRSQLLAGGGV